MKGLVKPLKYFAVSIAAIIALAYAFGFEYLFKGIVKTYLRGENSATIDDENLFPKNIVIANNPTQWQKDSMYNVQKLPNPIETKLQETNTASLLIIKNGKLLHEQYWVNNNENTRTNSFSMAKTVTVMLLGIAIEEGKIKSLNQKYSDFYSNYKNIEFGKDLTLQDLAAMEAGLDWDENYSNPFSPNAKAYYGNSLAKTVFLRGFNVKPGTEFEYQSGATQLLGFALRKAVDETLASYLSKKIWTPAGMEQPAYWSTDENDMEKTYCCIHAISRDYAKLGLMMMNKGKINGTQIIPADFVQKMFTPTNHSKGIYSLGMWVNEDNAIKHYYFQGLQGQYIIMIPEKDMIIVRTGSYKNQPKTDRGRPDLVKFLVNEISQKY